MFNVNCARCRTTRSGGYDGCAFHNVSRRRYTAPVAPTVVVVEHHGRYDSYDPPIGVDNQGDAVINLGGGIGIDARDGSVEIEVAPGFYVDTDSGSSWDSGSSYDSGSSDW